MTKGWARCRETRIVPAGKLTLGGLLLILSLSGKRRASDRNVWEGCVTEAVILRDANRLQRPYREQAG